MAVLALHAEWSRSGHAFVDRVSNISGAAPLPNRANANWFLQPGINVVRDTVVDTLAGSDEPDWYLYTFFEDLATDPDPEDLGTDVHP